MLYCCSLFTLRPTAARYLNVYFAPVCNAKRFINGNRQLRNMRILQCGTWASAKGLFEVYRQLSCLRAEWTTKAANGDRNPTQVNLIVGCCGYCYTRLQHERLIYMNGNKRTISTSQLLNKKDTMCEWASCSNGNDNAERESARTCCSTPLANDYLSHSERERESRYAIIKNLLHIILILRRFGRQNKKDCRTITLKKSRSRELNQNGERRRRPRIIMNDNSNQAIIFVGRVRYTRCAVHELINLSVVSRTLLSLDNTFTLPRINRSRWKLIPIKTTSHGHPIELVLRFEMSIKMDGCEWISSQFG